MTVVSKEPHPKYSLRRSWPQFEMDLIPQAFNPLSQTVDNMLPSLLVEVGRPQFAIGLVAREHMKRTHHDRVGHRHNRPLFPTAGGKAMIEGGQVRLLGPDRGMCQVGVWQRKAFMLCST